MSNVDYVSKKRVIIKTGNLLVETVDQLNPTEALDKI